MNGEINSPYASIHSPSWREWPPNAYIFSYLAISSKYSSIHGIQNYLIQPFPPLSSLSYSESGGGISASFFQKLPKQKWNLCFPSNSVNPVSIFFYFRSTRPAQWPAQLQSGAWKRQCPWLDGDQPQAVPLPGHPTMYEELGEWELDGLLQPRVMIYKSGYSRQFLNPSAAAASCNSIILWTVVKSAGSQLSNKHKTSSYTHSVPESATHPWYLTPLFV